MTYQLNDKNACDEGCCLIGDDTDYPGPDTLYGKQPIFKIKKDSFTSFESPNICEFAKIDKDENFRL